MKLKNNDNLQQNNSQVKLEQYSKKTVGIRSFSKKINVSDYKMSKRNLEPMIMSP